MLYFDDGTVSPPLYTLGVDLGDARDHTAIAILERPLWVGDEDSGWKYATRFVGGPEEGGWVAPDSRAAPADALDLAYFNMLLGRPAYPAFNVRHAERLPLGCGYPHVVSVVGEYMRRLEGYQPDLLIDHTGVGRPVIQTFRSAGLYPIGVHLHAGAVVHSVPEENRHNVGVRELVSSAQVYLEQGRLLVAEALEFAETLKTELLSFRRKINPQTAHESFSAWRERDHDDLVFALAMTTWWQTFQAEFLEAELQAEYLERFGAQAGRW